MYEEAVRYGLYEIRTKTARVARLLSIMLEREAAERHANVLCAQRGSVSIEVLIWHTGSPLPLTLPASGGSIIHGRKPTGGQS